MKKFTKILLATMLATTVLILSACGSTNEENGNDVATDQTTKDQTTSDQAKEETKMTEEEFNQELDKNLPIISEESELPQLSELKEGETIAILKTNKGDIKIRFFDELAPKTVENFVTLSKEGYYNGISFHRVINDFMIQGGDPTGTGTGGESIYGQKFDDEITPYLRHFSGAVAMANSGPNTNGSQFYIVENDDLSDEEEAQLKNFADNPKTVATVDDSTGFEVTNDRFIPPVVANEYIEEGGTPSLDGSYTIFGQVISGMDVVHAIAEVETFDGSDGQKDKPKEDVIINSVEITQYKK